MKFLFAESFKYLSAIAIFVAGSVLAFAENSAIVSWKNAENAPARERLGVTEKSICRYLDLDGDGFDEVLFPLPQQPDPVDPRFTDYGIARRTPEGTWVPVMMLGERGERTENPATMYVRNTESFVAFDGKDFWGETERVFSLRDVRYGLGGFYFLTPKGLISRSRESVLRHLSVGEFAFLRGLKIIREPPDEERNNSWKALALRLTSYGSLNVYRYAKTLTFNVIEDTHGGRGMAVPEDFFSFPANFRDNIVGVVLPRGNETRVGILFKEDLQYAPVFLHVKIRGKRSYKLLPECVPALERILFSDKKYETIFTEYFPDRARELEGKSLPVIWVDISPESWAIRIVSPPFCE